jgi:hypothetical protein
MTSKFLQALVTGAALALGGIGLPVASHATTYPIDLSNTFGNQPFGNVTVTQLGTQELGISVSINSGFFLTDGGLGAVIAFQTDEAVHYDLPAGWHPVGNGKTGGINMSSAGTFGGGIDRAGLNLGQNVSFDIFVTGTKTLSASDIVANKHGNFFAVDLISRIADRDRDRDEDDDGRGNRDDWKRGVAWANDPPATPIPGALVLFAPALGAGYLVLRRRRVVGRCSA